LNGPEAGHSDVDLSVSLGPLRLRNPILTASGTFGYGYEFSRVLDLSLLGGIVLKSVSRDPRPGNPRPRIYETPAGMLNSIGLENPGIDVFVDKILPRLRDVDTCVVVSVAGNRDDDFVHVVEKLNVAGPDAVELNVSCPNQAEGGMAYGTVPAAVERLVSAVRAATALPLIVKLTPNVTDIAAVARAAEAGGADAISCVNTFLGLMVDWRARKPRIAGIRGRGGVSGPAIKPMALRCVRDVALAVKVPVIGLGGILTADDVLEFMVSGASAVQVGTATFVEPDVAARLPSLLARRLKEEGIGRIGELVGTLADGP
jgi:dihydroorotate dehydrogenase (NAD+) catalytic subunit